MTLARARGRVRFFRVAFAALLVAFCALAVFDALHGMRVALLVCVVLVGACAYGEWFVATHLSRSVREWEKAEHELAVLLAAQAAVEMVVPVSRN